MVNWLTCGVTCDAKKSPVHNTSTGWNPARILVYANVSCFDLFFIGLGEVDTYTKLPDIPDIVLDLSITVAINPSSCNTEHGNTLCEHINK